MLLAAAEALAAQVPPDRLSRGTIFPSQDALRSVSRAIAVAVVRTARDQGVGRYLPDGEIAAAVDAAMWFPAY
jgi:malate dehydrogenase (oxaloacetate-decarboxylating)